MSEYQIINNKRKLNHKVTSNNKRKLNPQIINNKRKLNHQIINKIKKIKSKHGSCFIHKENYICKIYECSGVEGYHNIKHMPYIT